ncbi:MAG: dihydropteroate synthase [Cyanobacteria bacterium HKST-UBA04]|nr:dihydropteroate synthase [Cyanobacteria bacterium HKST-UBA04]MCA9842460.1 dihydropteroate synthase [Cyanobacteria bacterium HKST-UBA03]
MVIDTTPAPLTQATCFDNEADVRFQVRRIDPAYAATELSRIGFDPAYRQQAATKFDHWVIKAYDLHPAAMNILKQECIGLGAEAGVHREAITGKTENAPVLITATRSQLNKLLPRLAHQPFSLGKLASSIQRQLDRMDRTALSPIQVMAVMNITPDSFSDGGSLETLDEVVETAQRFIEAGAYWLDLGGESTRPGATEVPADVEQQRILPAIEAIMHSFPDARISIDTRKAAVAQAALKVGARLINDVSGFQFDADMIRVAADAQCPVVITHSQGTPQTMQQAPIYTDVVGDIAEFFYRQVDAATRAGVSEAHIILDPGFGFGKTIAHNLEILQRLDELVSIGFPLLVGTSRKSFLTLGDPSIEPLERETLTAATTALAIEKGAKLIRVHNPASQTPIVKLMQAARLTVPSADQDD